MHLRTSKLMLRTRGGKEAVLVHVSPHGGQPRHATSLPQIGRNWTSSLTRGFVDNVNVNQAQRERNANAAEFSPPNS